jgi:tripartite-type tricarboxylate transporter receptor subunit TctC
VTRVAEHSTTAIINDFIGSPFLVWGRANDHVCYTVGLCAHPRWITAIACRAILAQCRSTRRDPVVNENWSMYEGVSVLVRENNLFQQARDIRDRVAKATPAEWCTVARESADVPRCAEGAQTRAGAMKLSRRTFLHLASGAAMLRAALGSTRAEAYPARPVRIVVGFPPGQSADLIARLLAQWLSEQLVQPFIIDNRPGASNSIATEFVVHAPPDGYTLSNYVNATLDKHLPYNFIRDIEPVASVSRTPLVLEVNPAVPAKSVPEFIAYAKANPGKLNMASAGNGNSTHMAGELFKMMTGVNLIHVPYRGSAPAVTDLLAGQVQVMFDLMASSIGHIKGGTLRFARLHAPRRIPS